MGLVASPCTTGPFAAILGSVASLGFATALTLVLFYALGIGAPFFVVAVFALRMPKSGPWLVAVKSIIGLFLIGLALGYVRVAFSGFARLQLALGTFWIALIIAVVAGLALGAVHLSFGKSMLQSLRKATGIVLVSVGAFGLLGVFPSPVNWQLDADKAIATAKSAQKPVLSTSAQSGARPAKSSNTSFLHAISSPKSTASCPCESTVRTTTPNLRAIRDRFQVDGLPVMIVLNSRGEVAHVFRSRVPINDIVNVLRDVH